MRRRGALPFAVLAVLLIAGALQDAGLRWNASPSAPRGLWRLDRERSWKRGDFVFACLPAGELVELALARNYVPSGTCPSGAAPVLKRVAGLPGDAVRIEVDGVTINDVMVPATAPSQLDARGRQLPDATGYQRLLRDEVLLLSDRHGGGFDGRYWGALPTHAVLGGGVLLIP